MDQATVDKAQQETIKPGTNTGSWSFRRRYRNLAHLLSEVLPDSREKSLSLTNLQQSKFWAVEAEAKN